ncbi:MAG TPA: flavodoxin family protein [Thermodesulfobacteriota bacterium]|jgi:multimeric flavodoxin WrbA|nr:flavodoxin family protein [Thermodesulfobacteriota bacterium]
MKLMAIIGSPRKGGNTELLMDQVIAGCRSKTDVDLEKFFVTDKKIEYCTGCLSCVLPSPGTGKCVIKDDMAEILERMKKCDAFIFGSPNHMRTITAPLLNFLTRMLPLLEFRARYDEKGNRVGGEITSRIGDKKVAMIISQGEPYFCSSLVYEVLENNLKDFRLERAGNVVSMDNLEKGQVAEKEADLKKAFDLGVKLAIMCGFA